MTDESFPPETHRYRREKHEKIKEIRSLAAVRTSFCIYTFEICSTSLHGEPKKQTAYVVIDPSQFDRIYYF
jgi:hypothetical protein